MRKVRLAIITVLVILGLLAVSGFAGLMYFKKTNSYLYEMAMTLPQAKRPDLIYLPDNTPPAPRGYSFGGGPLIALMMGNIEKINTKKEFPIPESVVKKADVEYGRVGDRALLLDLYSPKTSMIPAPGLIFIHGGGWKSGDKGDYSCYTTYFAQKGYVAATVGYRFVQEAPLPACIEDVKCAVRWMRENAAQLNVDPNKIAVIGGSAGGHLSLMAGYTANVKELEGTGGHAGVSSAVAAVVDLYGPTDFTLPEIRINPTVTNGMKKSYAEDPALYRLTSPITHVTKDVPPTLIFQGTLDTTVPVSQSDMLAEKLKALGVPYWYACIDGYPHTMDILVPVNDYCKQVMTLFFDKYLRGK